MCSLDHSLCYNTAMQDAEIIQTIVSRITEAIHPQKIILFGSWAHGERGPHSDIDILVIQESSQPRPQRYAQVRRLFWGMGLPMDILVYTPEEFARYQAVLGSFTNTITHEGEVSVCPTRWMNLSASGWSSPSMICV